MGPALGTAETGSIIRLGGRARLSGDSDDVLILSELAQRGQARDVLGNIERLANEIDGEYVNLILREARGLAGSEPDSLDELAVDAKRRSRFGATTSATT